MMVVVRVRIEHTMFIMHCHPPEEPCIRKLVQAIVNSTERHLGTAIVYFAGQTVCRHVAMPPVKQQGSKRQTLAGWPQAGGAQPRNKISGLILGWR